MAGVKGRSGGARPNSGPKKKPPQVDPAADPKREPKADQVAVEATSFLVRVMQGLVDPSTAQLDAAKALLKAATVPAGGVKKARQDEAEQVAAESRFKPRPAPLKLVSGG